MLYNYFYKSGLNRDIFSRENHFFFTSRASVTQLCLEHAYLFLHCLCLIFSLDFLCDWDACLSRLFCCAGNFSPLSHYNCYWSRTWCTSNFELCLLSALILFTTFRWCICKLYRFVVQSGYSFILLFSYSLPHCLSYYSLRS